MTLVYELLEQTARVSLPPCGAPMDYQPQRLAFGHLDQDGLEEDALTVDVLEAEIPCEREPVQHTKSQTALACSMPENQVLLLKRRHLGVRRRLE